MGSHNIDFEIKGMVNKFAINQKFKRLQEENAAENGHQHGYSGDWQTIRGIDIRTNLKIFKDYETAYDYCLEHAKKYGDAIAVYYYTNDKTGPVANTLVAGWAVS